MTTSTASVSHPDLLTTLRQLYDGVDGYGLSSQGRSRLGDFSENLTYGEVTPEVVDQMLTIVDVQPGEVFADLGCGTGKALFFAAALKPIRKSIGVELLEELTTAAREAETKFGQQVRPLFSNPIADVEIVHGDMLAQDLSGVDIVFSHCTCFSPALMDALINHCLTLKPGSRVITVSKEVSAPHLEHIASQVSQMAWGSATLHCYRRI